MELRFDFATNDSTTGFRLSQFELYNWGTYNKSIVKLQLDKQNALLTGDIGSGKSTIVDALTTMLVPHQKIIFNKAAGANTKERTLYSYIVGEYKTAQDENFGNAKAIALRDNKSFSVLLSKFENEGYDEFLILAQVFYISQNKVNKFFVVSKTDISIKKNFFNFEDIKRLKKRLREIPHTSVYDNFKDYSKDFRRVMGIKNEQALNLFYQTVSLKSIGNLTEFLRIHMLESNNIDDKIDELCKNFSELNHTYDLVLKAKRQIELLKPISSDGKKYKNYLVQKLEQDSIKDNLTLYFASYKKELLDVKIKELHIELTKNISNKTIQDQQLKKIVDDLTNLKIELRTNGGDRLNQIDKEITQLNKDFEILKNKNEEYNTLIKQLGFSAVSNEHRFLNTLEDVKEQYNSIKYEDAKLQNEIMFDNHTKTKYQEQKDELLVEISYLKNNRSNIPQRVSKIRDNMANNLGVDISQLPFIGELIKVNDEEWQGAIERVLHNFSLSLLVDNDIYEKVSDYVEITNLKGKLVYLKVNTTKQSSSYNQSVLNSLLNKIEIKANSDYYDVINFMLGERFDIPCVDNLADFRKFKKALSINGQFKTNLTRHEKDDRFDIDDKSRWTLGWDNLEKLKKYEQDHQEMAQKIEILTNRLESKKKEQHELLSKRDILRDVLKFEYFESINWYRCSKSIDKLKDEKDILQKSSDIIKSLQDKIEQLESEQVTIKSKVDNLSKDIGRLEQNIDDREDEFSEAKLLLDNNTLDDELKEKIDTLREQLQDTKINLNNIKSSQNKIKEHVDKNIKSLSDKLTRNTTKLITNMGHFIQEFPLAAKEFDASIESLDEFESKLNELRKDNLPKWQKRFKELFKEKTIQNIVSLQSNLEYSASLIKKKIDTINQSLQDIEYSDGTFIELIAQSSNMAEIKEFKQRLKLVTQDSIGDDNSYDEQKFIQIKEIIDRFNGRKEYAEVDKRWRRTVTDVRNWFDFSAIEKYESDGSTKEYYTSSGGKSGGQKEKLAYTVLASSLAYQFGLEYNKVQSRSFRFVMIDEAFGKGSDESTKYALKLFEKLKLQLLVITPKTKINVIEPYIKSLHFVHNLDGMDSSLISMKIEEYQEKKNDK